jgi:threonine dehydrogenase-like Zn-dependent dehydrogenase
VLLFGVASPSTVIPVVPFDIFSKELTILGSFVNPHTHEEAISLVAQKRIHVVPFIGHRFSLPEVPDAMRNYGSMRVTKGIVLP